MKYYIDTEFIEGYKPFRIFGIKIPFVKPVFTIQLISIGIISEDGREYYAISEGYCFKDASDWVKKNVITPLYTSTVHGDQRNFFQDSDFHEYFGKSNQKIAEEILDFINNEPVKIIKSSNTVQLSDQSAKDIRNGYTSPEFYGYYADYDWVLFCSIFGTMMDLPKGFPMYCRDLKQMLDVKVESKSIEWGHNAENFDMLNHVKTLPNYPKQENEHNALDDAKWNLKLHEFIKTL